MLTFATLMMFVGATGKSAQIPLYLWLPDAMAGPTPVSALIHAATMVTAGIYLICRLAPLFLLTPITLTVVAWVGGATALFAAVIGLFQRDIKKVLAYSTVSQLGYMFLGLGSAGFAAGFLHLFTHAWFKALLFLGAGSVIHGLHHQQDLFRMGGLKAKMPVTFWTMVVATLCIMGFPGTSGFFSKDEILYLAFQKSPALYAMGLLGAACTAFYMWRLMALAFWGEPRDHHAFDHAHESPATMTAAPGAPGRGRPAGGPAGPAEDLGRQLRHRRLAGAGPRPSAGRGAAGRPSTAVRAPWPGASWRLSTTVALAAGFLGFRIYRHGHRPRRRPSPRAIPALYRVLSNKFYVDEAVEACILGPGPLGRQPPLEGLRRHPHRRHRREPARGPDPGRGGPRRPGPDGPGAQLRSGHGHRGRAPALDLLEVGCRRDHRLDQFPPPELPRVRAPALGRSPCCRCPERQAPLAKLLGLLGALGILVVAAIQLLHLPADAAGPDLRRAVPLVHRRGHPGGLPPGRGRAQPLAGAAHHLPGAADPAGHLEQHPAAGRHRRGPVPHAGDRHAGRPGGPGPAAVLPVLGSHAAAHVLPHRRLGRRRAQYAATKFMLFTLSGSLLWLVALLFLAGKAGSFAPAVMAQAVAGAAGPTPRTCCSWPSPWPSPSRCRCSPCTPGCRTPTPRRPPAAR